MAWVEIESSARISKKNHVRTQINNHTSTLENITDDIDKIIQQINFVMDGTETNYAEGWLRCCIAAKDGHVLKVKTALTQARDVVDSLSDCEWEWVTNG